MTHTPLANAIEELQAHLPTTGVLVVNDDLQAVQKPVLLTAEQFYGILTQVLVPSLYWPVGHLVNVDVQVVPDSKA